MTKSSMRRILRQEYIARSIVSSNKNKNCFMQSFERCKLQLFETAEQQPMLKYNFRDLTTSSWWMEYKSECLEHFWSVQAVQKFLLNPGDIHFLKDTVAQELKDEHNAAQKLENESAWTQTWSTEHANETFQQVQNTFGWIVDNPVGLFKNWLWIVVFCIMWIALWKSIGYLMEFIYDLRNKNRIVYMKIMLPRADSKADREVAKELAKDMKEKIWRMSQVYSSLHKLGHLSVNDNVMRWFFGKAKISFMLHYEEGRVWFIMATYPEYKKILESAVAAQYSDVSLESMEKPDFFTKKYHNIIPMQAKKEWAYPIRIFKQLEDDPLNNIIDSIAKISSEDTFTMMFTIKPADEKFNKKSQKLAEALYKKDESVLQKKSVFRFLLPWNWLGFLFKGPSEALIEKFSSTKQWWDPIIRMVKAEEEALNTMAEEAGKPAYNGGILLMSSSDIEERVTNNVYNVVSAFTVYEDEYNNELDQPEMLADLFGAWLKPLWKFAANFHIVSFFFKDNVFTVSELTSLFHLPDGLYNRSPVIEWMDYKVISAPDNLPQLKEENVDFPITGIIAESYKWGNLSEILAEQKNDNITTKIEVEEKKQEIKSKRHEKKAKMIMKKLGDKAKIVTQGEKKYLVIRKETHKTALKTYKDGVLLGLNVYRNQYSPIYMKKKDRTRHQYIIGKSGTGKSVYISMLARQDIWAGNGVCVIDPHGDLVEDILQYVPKHRAKDVVYFDAGNEERPMGLNLFEIKHVAESDRVVNDAVEIFIKMFGPEIFWPRIQEYFKYWSLTLLEDLEEGATLIDVPRLFTDEVFREYKTKKVKNPVVKNFRDKTYNAMGDREKQEIIPYFTSKFVSFIANSLIRNIIGQPESAFNFREVMDSEKILLINLSKGQIWQLNAQLLGMILVSKIYNAAMSRADIDEKERKFFYFYVDEFQNFVTDTFADILSEARKYKLCLVMAHQFIAQLEWTGSEKSQVKDAVFGNVWSMQSFKVGAPDAEFLEKEYSPVLVAQDILGISNYKAYIKLNINNATTRVFSMNSIFTQDYQSEKVRDILKQYCAKKYGRKKEFVDAEIAARLGMMWDEEAEETLEAIDGESAKPTWELPPWEITSPQPPSQE